MAYRRYTSLAFLAHCHPDIAAFYRYWDGKRRGRPMPSRSDIDPSEIKRFLPGVSLVDVQADPPGLVYRLVGTREVQARGADPTGKSVATHCIGAEPEEVVANYRHVIEHRQLVFDPEEIPSPRGRLEEQGSLFLPLSADGATVNMVLVYTHHRST